VQPKQGTPTGTPSQGRPSGQPAKKKQKDTTVTPKKTAPKKTQSSKVTIGDYVEGMTDEEFANFQHTLNMVRLNKRK